MLNVQRKSAPLPERHNCQITGKTKATAMGRQWVNTKLSERITNNATFAAGGQCVRFPPMTLGLTGGHYGECAGLLVGYSCSLALLCRDGFFQVYMPLFVRLWVLRNSSRWKFLTFSCSDICEISCAICCANCFFRSGMVRPLLTIWRRSSLASGANGDYSGCSLALRRWRRFSSCSTFSGKNPACLFSGADDFVSGCFLVIHQPFGSIPRCCSSLRSIRLIHVAKDESPSLRISSSSWARKSSGKRIWYWGDFFRFCIDMCNYPNYYFSVITRVVTFERKSNASKCLEPLPRRLTTNDSKIIEVAMRNHITHPQGRDLHNLNKFAWRFIALSAAKPRVIHIEATSEQEARQKNQLIAIASQGYDLSAPAKSGAGICTPELSKAIYDAPASFLSSAFAHIQIMVSWAGASKDAPVPFDAGSANPVQFTTSEICTSGGGSFSLSKEAANMATVPTLSHPQTAFIWRFIAFGASEPQIIHVTAWTEREARNRCPSGCVAVFAARIRQGVCHA